MSAELWSELCATMRAVRIAAGRSLREVEQSTGRGRGTLSQIETGRTRPNRALVEWYDTNLDGDGLLQSMFAEARGAHSPRYAQRRDPALAEGDRFAVVDSVLALGEYVAAGSIVKAGWTLCNGGRVDWAGRTLSRVGTPSAPGLIASAPSVPVPPCSPGEVVVVEFEVTIPPAPLMFAAYWEMLDEKGRRCFRPPSLLSMKVVSR